jgi:hypothetical protein
MAAYGWPPELIAAMEQQWLKDNRIEPLSRMMPTIIKQEV